MFLHTHLYKLISLYTILPCSLTCHGFPCCLTLTSCHRLFFGRGDVILVLNHNNIYPQIPGIFANIKSVHANITPLLGLFYFVLKFGKLVLQKSSLFPYLMGFGEFLRSSYKEVPSIKPALSYFNHQGKSPSHIYCH